MKERAKKVYEMAGNLNTTMSFAIYTNSDRIVKHKHAYRVWHMLKDFGCKVYVVAQGLTTYEGSKIYPDFKNLAGKVDVIIPCLGKEYLTDLVENAAETKAKTIWYQENNWSPEYDEQCKNKGIEVIRGCALKHKIYSKPFAYLNPCYWHGWKENKVPSKYNRI